jgi:hypothetical protein
MGGAELDPTIQEDWWWLRKSPPGNLVLQPAIITGTVLVTNNSAAITFSSAPAVDLDNWFFKVDAHEDVFRISAHTAALAAATLDSVYTGTTTAAATYKVFKLEYDLASDVLRPIAPMRGFRAERQFKVGGMDIAALDDRMPLTITESGVPDAFAMVDENTVRFNRYPGTASTDLLRLEYDYLYKPAALTDSGTEEPVVPIHWRHVLSDWATMWLFLDKNDDRVDGVGLAAKNGLRAMAIENRHKSGAMAGGALGQIRPRQDQYQRAVRGPLRTAAGLIIG